MLGKEQKGTFCDSERGRQIVTIKCKVRRTACSFLFAAWFLLAGCVTTSDIESLREDTNKLQRDNIATKDEVKSLKEKTAGVAREESFNIVRQSQAEIQSAISNLQKDVQVLSGRFDENKYFFDKTLKNSSSEIDLLKVQITSIEGRVKELKDRLTALERQAGVQKEFSEPLQESEKKSDEPRKETLHDEQALKKTVPADRVVKYEAAYNAFQNKRYKEAREKFEGFIKEFPKDQLSDNAYFWVAETLYNEKDFEGAILAYETVLKKYPNSDKVPSALLKQGRSFIEIGDRKTGKTILDQLMERYPKSKEAELAKKEIENLDKKPVKKKK
jgi:tol-pal system protein YbgF